MGVPHCLQGKAKHVSDLRYRPFATALERGQVFVRGGAAIGDLPRYSRNNYSAFALRWSLAHARHHRSHWFALQLQGCL